MDLSPFQKQILELLKAGPMTYEQLDEMIIAIYTERANEDDSDFDFLRNDFYLLAYDKELILLYDQHGDWSCDGNWTVAMLATPELLKQRDDAEADASLPVS